MSRFLCRTLIRSTSTASLRSKPCSVRWISTQPESSCYVEVSLSEASLVEKIEDAIHRNIVKRSVPDWLPFVPGASYWVPPRRSSYGVAEIVNKLTNPLNEDQFMAVTSLQGWPSSDFYVNNDVESSSGLADGETSSTTTTLQEEES